MKERKKVLLVITKSNWGGAQRYVYDMALGLHNAQYDVSVAVGGQGELVERLRSLGLNVFPIPSLINRINAASDIKAFFELWTIIAAARPDVVHLNSSKIGALGGLAARLAGVRRIIFTIHGFAFNEERSELSKKVFRLIYWITMMLCHHNIAVSHAVRAQVSRWPFINKRISVVWNGLRPVDFISQKDAREKLGLYHIEKNAWILGTIAELHPIKGLKYSIKAFEEFSSTHPNTHYVIIGEGEDRRKLEKSFASNAGSAGKVNLIGHVKEASRYLKAFDAFILPSLSEALGYVVLEAGSAGLPVIASAVGGLPEIIDNGKNGILVPAKDIEKITSAITKIHDDKKLAGALGEELQKKVTTEFSLEKMIAKTIALY